VNQTIPRLATIESSTVTEHRTGEHGSEHAQALARNDIRPVCLWQAADNARCNSRQFAGLDIPLNLPLLGRSDLRIQN
jgi:hypothetical protein